VRAVTLTPVGASRVATVLAAIMCVVTGVLVSPSVTASGAQPAVRTISMTAPHPYKPVAAVGTSDDYHCTLVNPHVARDQYIVSSKFVAGSAEVHHAALFLLPPSLAATAERDNKGGRGWTCFGLPLPSSDPAGLAAVPLLTFWTPGAGVDDFPKGTGVPLPAGSLVVMQVHYTTLLGDQPVKNSLVLRTVPESAPLLPLHLNLMLAPPDIPCPTGVTGTLCDRVASLANLGQRFGQTAVEEVDGIESLCGNNPSDPPEGDSTSCSSKIGKSGYIVRVYAHMHLLGQSFTMVLNPGTPEAKTVLNVPTFDFHDQKSYNLRSPIAVSAGEPVQVTCSYDPTLAQELPILRSAPPHFVTWGDGSTDEMCIGIAWTSSVLPNSHDSI
jgi:Copper type II ascorbate-dependent monooxygenase, C-terminal domain